MITDGDDNISMSAVRESDTDISYITNLTNLNMITDGDDGISMLAVPESDTDIKKAVVIKLEPDYFEVDLSFDQEGQRDASLATPTFNERRANENIWSSLIRENTSLLSKTLHAMVMSEAEDKKKSFCLGMHSMLNLFFRATHHSVFAVRRCYHVSCRSS